jgi:hypothetical protein
MARFTTDNTEGYDTIDLPALNEAYETIMAAVDHNEDRDSIEFKSWQDRIAEELLARYDAGERDKALTRQ